MWARAVDHLCVRLYVWVSVCVCDVTPLEPQALRAKGRTVGNGGFLRETDKQHEGFNCLQSGSM